MKWRLVNRYYWARACGRYTVDVVQMPESPTGQRCTAWRRPPEGSFTMAVSLGCFDSLRDAFAACKADDVIDKRAA